MDGVPGFEPGNAGIKTQCLTTWRHPNIYENINNYNSKNQNINNKNQKTCKFI